MTTHLTYTLPDGQVIYHHQAYETDFVYKEIFVEQIYTKAFPDLPTNPCVIDAGANIGLFSLLIKQQFPQASIYTFEPSPLHFQLCQLNLKKFNGVFIPDEHFFINLFQHLSRMENIKRARITYVKWKSDWRPTVFNRANINVVNEARKSNALFMRKVTHVMDNEIKYILDENQKYYQRRQPDKNFVIL